MRCRPILKVKIEPANRLAAFAQQAQQIQKQVDKVQIKRQRPQDRHLLYNLVVLGADAFV